MEQVHPEELEAFVQASLKPHPRLVRRLEQIRDIHGMTPDLEANARLTALLDWRRRSSAGDSESRVLCAALGFPLGMIEGLAFDKDRYLDWKERGILNIAPGHDFTWYPRGLVVESARLQPSPEGLPGWAVRAEMEVEGWSTAPLPLGVDVRHRLDLFKCHPAVIDDGVQFHSSLTARVCREVSIGRGVRVAGDLELRFCGQVDIGEDVEIAGDLRIRFCDGWTISKGVRVGGKVDLHESSEEVIEELLRRVPTLSWAQMVMS